MNHFRVSIPARAAGLLLLAALVAGCAGDPLVRPEGYVTVKDPWPFDWKAVNAEGHALTLTVHENEAGEGGTLAFWARAVERQKTKVDGYKLIDRQDLAAERGAQGVAFQFEAGTPSQPVTYLVGLFVRDPGAWRWAVPGEIYVLEAGGPKEAFEADRAAVIDAMKTLR